MPPDLAHSITRISTKDPGFSFLYEPQALKPLPAAYSTSSASRQTSVAARLEAQAQAKSQEQNEPALPPRPPTRHGTVHSDSNFTRGGNEQLCVRKPFAPREYAARARAGDMAREPSATGGRGKTESPVRAFTDCEYREKCRSGKLQRWDFEPSLSEQSAERGHASPPVRGRFKQTAKLCEAGLRWLKSTVSPRRGRYYG